jgi:FMN reductase
MPEARPLIVGIGGTTRIGSTSESALRLALSAAAQQGARVRAFTGADLPLEPYDPSSPARSKVAEEFVAVLRKADGVIISTPSYHGLMSGLLKNALDYTEDMRNDPRPYFDGRAVGCIVCAEGPQAMGSTLQGLRSMVHALRGWPTPFAATINSSARPFGPGGESREATTLQHLEIVASQVLDFARMRLALVEPPGEEVQA